VNNVIEALVSIYKRFGGRPNLLRIGSKGITAKIRPYHTAELRERYRVRFEGAVKYRASLLASSIGIPRELSADVFEIEQKLGTLARRCIVLRQLTDESVGINATDREKNEVQLRRAEASFSAAAKQLLDRTIDVTRPMDELEQSHITLLTKYKTSSQADITAVRSILELSRDWLNSMASPQRNFEEFLAKTRSIVTATCVGVGQTKIRIDSNNFDWVIVDEAARCTPSELAVPIQMGRRILLVGDHHQLMPMISRNIIGQLRVEDPDVPIEEILRSDFERSFISAYGRTSGKTLTEQYRMHPAICEIVSNCFYEPHKVQLKTSEQRASSTQLSNTLPNVLTKPLCWIDTSDERNHRESQLQNSTSFYNDAEVTAVVKILECFSEQGDLVTELARGDEESPIGIICMYSSQKRKIEMAIARHAWPPRFRPLIRVDTVDAYQGKENTIVIVSLVRATRDPGHVRSDNRCNVAMSRAKEKLIIVGSKPMWENADRDLPMKRVIRFMTNHPATSAFGFVKDLG